MKPNLSLFSFIVNALISKIAFLNHKLTKLFSHRKSLPLQFLELRFGLRSILSEFSIRCEARAEVRSFHTGMSNRPCVNS